MIFKGPVAVDMLMKFMDMNLDKFSGPEKHAPQPPVPSPFYIFLRWGNSKSMEYISCIWFIYSSVVYYCLSSSSSSLPWGEESIQKGNLLDYLCSSYYQDGSEENNNP